MSRDIYKCLLLSDSFLTIFPQFFFHFLCCHNSFVFQIFSDFSGLLQFTASSVSFPISLIFTHCTSSEIIKYKLGQKFQKFFPNFLQTLDVYNFNQECDTTKLIRSLYTSILCLSFPGSPHPFPSADFHSPLFSQRNRDKFKF